MPAFVWQNFNAGEVSAKLNGRADFAKYFNSLESGENFISLPQGPITRRPGLQYIANAKSATQSVRLVPFIFSVSQSYMLEFGNQYIRFYKDKAQILSAGSPYEIASPYAYTELSALAFAQSNDVMYIVHPSYAVRKLTRIAHDSWTLTTVNFRPPGLQGPKYYPLGTMTLGAVSGNSVAVTFSSAIMLNGYVGREIRSGSGRASILTYGSSTTATVDIIDAFASVGPIANGSWYMDGSPVGGVTPSAVGPVGSIINITSTGASGTTVSVSTHTEEAWSLSGGGAGSEYYLTNYAGTGQAAGVTTLPTQFIAQGFKLVKGELGTLGTSQWAWGDNDTLGFNTVYLRLSGEVDPDTMDAGSMVVKYVTAAADLFTVGDIGKYILINSGLGLITQQNTPGFIKAQVIKELSAITEDVGFSIFDSAWNATDGYPEAVAFHDGRLFFAMGNKIWGSVIEDYENFTPGVDDDDTVTFAIKADNVEWLLPLQSLINGADDGIYVLNASGENVNLTPTNVSCKLNSSVQASGVEPMATGSSVIFVDRARTHLYEAGYQIALDSVVSNQLDILADHITRDKVKQIACQQNPYGIIWGVTDAGGLFSATYLPHHEVIAFAPHTSPFRALFVSVATIPGMSTDTDTQVWVAVKRYLNGAWVQCVELLSEFFEGDTSATGCFLDCSLGLDEPIALANIEQLDTPPVTTSAPHGLSNGDYVIFGDDIAGMEDIRGQTAIVISEYTEALSFHAGGGSFRADLVNGSAMVWLPGMDLRPFAGIAGTKTPFKITVTDPNGKTAIGYLAAQGSGETLATELVLDGDGEADPNTNWTAAYSTLTAVTGGQVGNCISVEDTSAGTYGFCTQHITLVQDALYKVVAYHKKGTGLKGYIYLLSGGAVVTAVKDLTDTDWTEHELYGIAFPANGTAGQITLANADAAGVGTQLFDSISVKRVLTGPEIYSLRVVSTKDGSTYNWASIDSGFNPYHASGLTVLIEAVATDVFVASGIDASAYDPYISGGSVRKKVTSVSGLSHLEGETVQVAGDGGVLTDEVVSSGSITLSARAAQVFVGGHYDSIAKTLRIASPEQPLFGTRINVVQMAIMFYQTLGGYAGFSEDALHLIEFRTIGDPLGSAPDVYTGEKVLVIGGGWAYGGQVTIKQAQPLPMTICAIGIRIDLENS